MENESEILRYEYSHNSPELLCEIKIDFFFSFPFLVELDLSCQSLTSIPLSISQCFLLERINISGNPMNRPPLVLFSLPRIRENPDNLIFGANEHCTANLMQAMIKDTKCLNHLLFEVTDITGNLRKVSFSPDTSVKDFTNLVVPEIGSLVNYIFLVRTVIIKNLTETKEYVLNIIPDDTPLSLYAYPDATWSFSLKYLPPFCPDFALPLLLKFVRNGNEFSNLSAYKALALAESIPHFSSVSIVVPLYQRKDLIISYNRNSAALSLDMCSSYFVFDISLIQFDAPYENENSNIRVPVFIYGDRALKLDLSRLTSEKMSQFLRFLSLANPHFIAVNEKNNYNFEEFAMKARLLGSKIHSNVVYPSKINKLSSDEIKKELDKLKQQKFAIEFIPKKIPISPLPSPRSLSPRNSLQRN